MPNYSTLLRTSSIFFACLVVQVSRQLKSSVLILTSLMFGIVFGVILKLVIFPSPLTLSTTSHIGL